MLTFSHEGDIGGLNQHENYSETDVLLGAVVGSDKHILYSLAAFGIPSTAPKTSFWSNSLLFGAVVGSDKHVLYSLAAFGIPSTAPKTSFWSNSLLFGAVVGSDKHVLY